MFKRGSGVLLHPTSLHGGHGVGDLGPSAREFVDFLKRARQSYWQMLPLGPVGPGECPYQARSSFAGEPLLISLDLLVEDGLLPGEDLTGGPGASPRAEYGPARAFKTQALRRSFDGYRSGAGDAELRDAFAAFRAEEGGWLEDYALFAALKDRFEGASWNKWPDRGVVERKPEALDACRAELGDEVEFHAFAQFLFFRQWRALREYARESGVRLIGDLPIYCAHDSADVWSSPQFFSVTRHGNLKYLAGVPPDAFSSDGQLWSNPVYDWAALREDGYRWWVERVRASLEMVDLLRIDHFRGLESYWRVRAGAKTARKGKWMKGPGIELFDAIREELGEVPIIAEDLGMITSRVEALREAAGVPGMKVLQFAFGRGANMYRPHTYEKNCVVYTGTHDNDTTRGWYEATGPEYAGDDRAVIERERDLVRRYIARDGSDITWDFIRLALSSVADIAVIPMQDILDLGGEARMNRPGVASGQWDWRLTPEQFASAWSERLADLCRLYGRPPKKRKVEPASIEVEAEEEGEETGATDD